MALSDAVSGINDMEQNIGHAGHHSRQFSGTLQAFQASLASEPFLIVTALLAVYIVLGILYESYIHPITILSTLPSAGVGAVLALMLFHIGSERHRADRHHPADRHREEERDPDDRLRAGRRAQGRQESQRSDLQACLLRFRPILMTTMAALLGALPLALGHGHRLGTAPSAGHRHRRRTDLQPVLTLYTTPVVYLYLDRLSAWWQRVAPGKPLRIGAHRRAD